MRITEYSIKHAVTTYVLIGVIIVAGLVTYRDMPREAAPEIEIPVVLVTTPYIGVSPEDIESLITRPLERELKEIQDIDELRSTSAEGASIISVKFAPEANLDEALQEVRDKVDLAKPELPRDAEDPAVKAISTADFPMMIVNVTGAYSIVRLRQVAEDLQDRIEGIAGIMEVKLAGGLEREIQVRVNPMRLDHHGISLQTVVNAIRGENVNMPGGDVKVGDARLLVRVPGELSSADDLPDIVVKMRGDLPVYLRDVAEVHDSFKERTSESRLDGRNNISLTITKRPGENIIAAADAVKKLLAQREPLMPAGTEIVILGDESKNIFDMVRELENNLISGLMLVISVIMVVMGLRNSILVGLAIPLSMLVSFVVLGLADITLNMIVLFSLILALGMLVDNAIVIVENIYRHASEGLDRVQAALVGTREVAWPVTTSTATTVAAFLPLMFWPGIEGEFMGFLPMTLIVTLSASLFIALVITPVLCAAFLRPGAPISAARGRSEAGSGLAERLRRAYERLLSGAVLHPWRTVLCIVVFSVLTVGAFAGSSLGVIFFPDVTPRKIFVDVDTGDGTRLAFTDELVSRVEAAIHGNANIKHYVADIGSGGSGLGALFGGSSVPHKGRVSVDFVDPEDRQEPVSATIETVRRATRDLPGARIDLQKEQMGPPVGAPVEIEIYGDDFHELGALSQRLRNHIKAIPGLVDLRDDYSAGRPELRVHIDRERAAILGASTGLVADTLRTAINGVKASVLRDGVDEYDITVRLAEDYRSQIADLQNLRINVASRKNPNVTHLIPLAEVAQVQSAGGTGSIRHKDAKRVVTIKGNAEGRLSDAVLRDVQAAMERFDLPDGYSIAYAGENQRRGESEAFLSKAFMIALLLIALILVTQFNSVFVPVTILLAVQLSLLGVFWGQIITRLPFGIIMTGLGVISLAGIVVNNAIVLVDYVQQLRAAGVPRNEALVRAGLVRLRPVLLTAVTTVLGLTPMALGVSIDFASLSLQVGGQTADFWQPMATAVIFGLMVATVLTLVVVPVLYAIFDSFEGWLRRVGGGTAQAVSAGGPSEAAAMPPSRS